MKYSVEMNLIAHALLAVQNELEPVVKDASNSHFKSKYASLDTLTEYVRPILAKHHLVLIQGGGESTVMGNLRVETMILHESGQWVKSEFDLPMATRRNREGDDLGFDPQAAGSAITYGRRYGLCAMLAISLDDDDDAEAAVKRMRTVGEQTGHRPRPRPEPRLPNETDADLQGYKEGPACPKCGSDMWDNRTTKKNPKAPDYKCKDRSCDGVIWPEKTKAKTQQAALPLDDGAPPLNDDDMPY